MGNQPHGRLEEATVKEAQTLEITLVGTTEKGCQQLIRATKAVEVVGKAKKLWPAVVKAKVIFGVVEGHKVEIE